MPFDLAVIDLDNTLYPATNGAFALQITGSSITFSYYGLLPKGDAYGNRR